MGKERNTSHPLLLHLSVIQTITSMASDEEIYGLFVEKTKLVRMVSREINFKM